MFIIVIVALIVVTATARYLALENSKINYELNATRNELQTALDELNTSKTEYESLKAQLENTNNELQSTHNKLQQQADNISNLNQEIEDMKASLFGNGQEFDVVITQSDVEMIAKTVWGEARGQSTIEKAAVIWCILNRVDAKQSTIAEIITAPNQFVGYDENHPATEELCALAKDVLARWQLEKLCSGNVGRVLPGNYLWFSGYAGDNHFRDAYDGEYNIWNWNCWNPYE